MKRAMFALLFSIAGQHAEGQLPIVFLPGTGGSVLRFRETNEPYWVSSKILRADVLERGDASRHAESLYASEVLATVGHAEIERLKLQLQNCAQRSPIPLPIELFDEIPSNYPIYEKFLKWAGEVFGDTGFYAAPYDWRLRPAASLNQIDAVVERARSEHRCSQVILICHSLGGLVGREYLATKGKGKVAQIISIGTPWLGTPQSARALLHGSDFGIGVDLPKRLPGLPSDLSPEIRVRVPDLVFGDLVLHSPGRISFLPSRSTRQLARSFPSLYLMNPAAESGKHIARLLGRSANENIGVVAEWSADECDRHLQALNRQEFDWAQQWRDRHLSGESHGAKHCAIGLVSPASAKKSEWQFVRFSALRRPQTADLPRKAQHHLNRLTERLDRVGVLDGLASEVAQLQRRAAEAPLQVRRRLVRELDESTSLSVELDEFIPTHLDRRWGDGTVPLFSATAGAASSLGDQPDAKAAQAVLGTLTSVFVAELSNNKSHMSALDDSNIRALILQFCNSDRILRKTTR